MLCDILYLSFGFWTNILGRNLKDTFRHLDETSDSRTSFLCVIPEEFCDVLISIVGQIAASTDVSHILAVSFFSLH
jgi:hypothetical protein